MKSTVVKVSYKKEFPSKNGQMHSWHVTMDNGDMGETVTKSDTAPWQVGDEAEYNLTYQEYNGEQYAKIKKVFANANGTGNGAAFSGGKKPWTPNPESETRRERWAKQIMITRQACMNTSMSLISAGCGESTLDNLFGLAEKMEAWVKRGIDPKTLVPQQPAQPEAAPTAAVRPASQVAPPVRKPEPAFAPALDDDLPF